MKGLESILMPNEAAMFKSLAHPMQVKAGYVIFEDEDQADSIYLVETGHVKIYRSANSGQISMISIRKSGDVIGIASVLLAEKRCAFAEAIEKCQLWRMEAKDFMDMIYACPRLAVQIAIVHGKYLRDAERAIGNLMSMDADRRVAWLLMKLASVVPTPRGEKLRITVRLTHQDMANMIGTCRQTVTTVLGRFKKAGVIEVGKQCIDIIDFNKLNEYVV